MVWNSAGSTLYKAVERHNSGASDDARHTAPEQPPPPSPVCGEAERRIPPRECQGCPRCACAEHQSGLEALLRDKDFVLLAGLMLLLMHEKADSKLILALAFVLFG